ncbi:Fertility restorer-like protein [Rhynchospora pubera]|uniref:Fertility restorer-like protein n=1 Tax=Rhynchospora pubera TaxID=906938 RepID=A0AAV8BQR0_9POAL|nr:Fertility restorer-like protein [Rhynchospora pubera]
MSGKAAKALASHVEKLVKQRCDAEKLQLQQLAKINHPDSFPTLLALFNRFKRPHTDTEDAASLHLSIPLDLGFCVLGQSLREGCGANTIMFGSLIKGLRAMKQLGDAAKVFAKMPLLGCHPNVIIYTTLIDAFCKCGQTKTGLELSRRMAEEGSCCKPNVVTYTTLIHGFCREAQIAEAMKLLREMVTERLKPDVITFNILIDVLCKNGDVKAAQKVFKEMPTYGIVPDLYTHNSLIDGLCKNGNVSAR